MAVSTASVVCRHVQARLTDSSRIDKADSSPVTVADFAAQAVINAMLPDQIDLGSGPVVPFTMVGEESASMLKAERVAGIGPDAGLGAAIADALDHSGAMKRPSCDDLIDLIDRAKPTGPLPETFWTADPIDGTRGFLKGRQYAVCLALIHRGRPVVGLLACPNLGDTDQRDPSGSPVIDARNSGTLVAGWSGSAVQVAPIDKPDLLAGLTIDSDKSHSTILMTQGVEPGQSKLARYSVLTSQLDSMSAKTGRAVGPTWRLDSQAKYALVAIGRADVYIRFPYHTGSGNENIWDHASGALLCQQAGCVVTDLDGTELDFSRPALATNRGVLAAAAELHAIIRQAISAAGL